MPKPKRGTISKRMPKFQLFYKHQSIIIIFFLLSYTFSFCNLHLILNALNTSQISNIFQVKTFHSLYFKFKKNSNFNKISEEKHKLIFYFNQKFITSFYLNQYSLFLFPKPFSLLIYLVFAALFPFDELFLCFSRLFCNLIRFSFSMRAFFLFRLRSNRSFIRNAFDCFS